VTTLLAAAALSGCAVGRPTGFTARSNSFCSDTNRQLAALKVPTTPKAHLQFATDRYTALEHLVSELTDSSLPGGSAGQQLRVDWLRPARSSLRTGRTVLADLRTAVRAGDNSAVVSAFVESNAVGTAGVDLELLRSRNLTTCVRSFTPTIR
jgi:hypothetical protein